MSWTDFYRRRELLDSVIHRAAQTPDGAVPFSEVPGAREEFGSVQNLLLALHHRWSLILTGHVRAELTDARDGEHSDAVTRAWHTARDRHPELHALVVEHIDETPEMRAMHETDLRMLAIAAGLAEPDEPTEEITKVGNAFLALTTQRDAPRPRRRNPMDQLRRLLAPTA